MKTENIRNGEWPDIEVEHHDDFISIYKNVFPPGYCSHMISEFERLKSIGVGNDRLSNRKKHHTEDFNICLLPKVHLFQDFKEKNPISGFFEMLQMVFDNYSRFYSYLKDIPITCTNMKMQKSDPGQGYHLWHAEAGTENNFHLYTNRAVVYSLYLNTLDLPEEGGETEFLYQKKRIPPVENTMLLWPASYTHVHRGNSVLGQRAKYIITGWFYYED